MTNRSWHLLSISLALASASNAAFAQAQDGASAAPGDGERHCRQRVVLPIGGQVGRDGAWHPSPTPVPPAAVGGGPCEPEESSAAPDSTTPATSASHAPDEHIAPATPTSVREVHSAPPVAVGATPAPVPPRVVATTAAPVVLVPTPAPVVLARGGGPYIAQQADVYMPPRPRPPARVARLILGAGFGTGLYTVSPNAQDLGLAWHADLGVEFVRIVSVEARYHGASNQVPVAIDPTRGFGLTNNGVSALARLAIPFPYVRPFVQGGIGYVWFAATGAATAAPQNAFPSSLAEVPVGGGVEIRPVPAFGFDLEYTYQFLVDSRWEFNQTAHPWGDLWSATGSLRFYL